MTAGGRGAGRLVGLDVARCLALLGMVATHVLDPFDDAGGVAFAQQLAGGRASALFAVLAGVSLALMSGRQSPVTGRDRVATSVALTVRALLIAALGLALGELDSGLAVILTYYGLLFLLGIPFVGLRAPALFSLAAVWLVVAPVVSHWLRPELPERGFEVPTLGQLADPGQLLSELAFTGYYPVVPWLAYLLVGMALGRLALVRRPAQVGVAVTGLVLAVASTLLSRALTSLVDMFTPQLLDELVQGQAGTTPTGGPWSWLLVVAPHSATPFDLAQTIGSAMTVIGVCLLLVGLLPRAGARAAAIAFGAGTMTLSLYSLHVVMRTEPVWPPEEPASYVWHVVVLLWLGAAFVALGRRGPLEWLVTKIAGGVARVSGRRVRS